MASNLAYKDCPSGTDNARLCGNGVNDPAQKYFSIFRAALDSTVGMPRVFIYEPQEVLPSQQASLRLLGHCAVAGQANVFK